MHPVKCLHAAFIECTRDGINLIDNNLIWNVEGRFQEADIPDEPGSSGWYKMKEHDVVNGYGIYGEGTDHLRIVSNLIGRCRSAGYFSKPVSFRMGGMQRGGTSRDARIVGNLKTAFHIPDQVIVDQIYAVPRTFDKNCLSLLYAV